MLRKSLSKPPGLDLETSVDRKQWHKIRCLWGLSWGHLTNQVPQSRPALPKQGRMPTFTPLDLPMGPLCNSTAPQALLQPLAHACACTSPLHLKTAVSASRAIGVCIVGGRRGSATILLKARLRLGSGSRWQSRVRDSQDGDGTQLEWYALVGERQDGTGAFYPEGGPVPTHIRPSRGADGLCCHPGPLSRCCL